MDKYDFKLDMNVRDSNVILLDMIKPNSTVLEFGPYKGRMTKYLKEVLKCRVYAVEIDKDAAEVCSKYADKVIVGDIENYVWIREFKDIKFDNIIFADVLEHLINSEDVLKKAKTLLKHDGAINVSIPNITHNSVLMNMYNDEFNYTETGILDSTHVRFFGYNNLINLIYRIGMVPTTQDATYCLPGQNEIDVKYSNFNLALQQELKKRRYGNVYQFIFEIKNYEYVNSNNIMIQKNIKSNIQYNERIIVNIISPYNQEGDNYREYRVNINKTSKINIKLENEYIEALRIEMPNLQCILKVSSFGVKNNQKELLNFDRDIKFEEHNIVFISYQFNYFNINVNNNYEYIEIYIEQVLLNENEMKKLWLENQGYYYTVKEMKNQAIILEEEMGKIKKDSSLILKENEKIKKDSSLILKENEKIKKNHLQLIEQVQQKDANNQYILELLKEKDDKLNQIVNTKGWRLMESLRRSRNKVLKYLSNPSLLKYRIFGHKKKPNLKKVQYDTNSNNELISVVIPIYNRTSELIESIESILNQTYKNIELILVCDGSPKETLDIVESYRENPKVRIYKFYNNSGNAVRGRNKAIREAKGAYLAFQDSDDIAEPYRLEISLKYLKEYNADVVYGGWRAKIDGTRNIDLKNGQEIMSPDCDYEFLKEICVPCQSTVMVKIAALRDVGGLKDKMRYREDHELWLRLAYFGYKFKAIPKILTNLRLHENNLELSFKDNDEYWQELTIQEHKIKNEIKPKIGYIIAGCDISGGLSVVCKHANELLDKGYDVTLICTNGSTCIDWYPNQRVEIVPISKVEFNYDILIATFWITAYDMEKIPAKRKIYFVQSDESKFYSGNSKDGKMALSTYKMSYEFITMANWIKEWLREEFNQNAIVIPNGIDSKIIYKTNPIVPKTDKLRVLIEGPTTIPFKGVEKAFEIVKNLDCEVWCVSSEGRLKPEWKCDMFFEKVKFEEMKNIYSSCDILLKMSEVESFCLPALEMMACGGIPIVAEVKGVDEFLIDGKNGFITKQGDLKTPRKIIQMLIDNPTLKENIIKAAIETSKIWSWDNAIYKLEQNVINRK